MDSLKLDTNGTNEITWDNFMSGNYRTINIGGNKRQTDVAFVCIKD